MSKKCTPLWREAHFQVKNAQSTPFSDHFWKLRCRKSARRCGAKHISKSKSEKKKKRGVRNTFGRSAVVLRGRHKGFCTFPKVSKTWGFCSSFNYNHHYTTLHYTTLHYNYNYNNNYNYNYTTLHHATIHYTPLHNTTLNYTTLHELQLQLQLQLHYTTLHFTSLHSITPQYNYNYTTLHFTSLHYTQLRHTTATTTTTTTLHYTNCTTLITLHSTTLHYTTLH